MTELRRIYRLCGFCFIIFLYFLSCFCANLFLGTFRRSYKRLQRLANITSFFSRQTLKLLGFSIKHDLNTPGNKCLIISNHVSYIDILVISSIIPSIFVTSLEVKKQFFLGFLCELAGTLFVSRRAVELEQDIVFSMSRIMSRSCPICLFPEATSTDGSKLLPFKSSLFQSIIDIKGYILPLYLEYSNNSVAYYGAMQFFSHFWNLLKVKETEVIIRWCDPVFITSQSTRKQVSQETYKSILNEMEASLGRKI